MPEVREDCCETVSSGHDIAVALMNSQQLWLFAQEMHKFKADNMQASMREGSMSPRRVEKLLAVDGCWERGHTLYNSSDRTF